MERGNVARDLMSSHGDDSALDQPVQDRFLPTLAALWMKGMLPNGRLVIGQEFSDVPLDQISQRWERT